MQSNIRLPTLKGVDLTDKRVIVRLDLNVPLDENGNISDDTRILESLETLSYLVKKASKVVILSHLGRPSKEEYEERFSLKPVAKKISELLNRTIPVANNFNDLDRLLEDCSVVMFENVRFQKGEKENAHALSRLYAKRADLFVMDSFGTSHREHSSTCGIIEFVDYACAGFLLEREIKALEQILYNPASPVVAIVGGSKVSTKLEVLRNLVQRVDYLIPGGGIANTLLLAKNINMQASLVESGMVDFASDLLKEKFGPAKILLPKDAIAAASIDDDNIFQGPVEEIPENFMMLDIGPRTIKDYQEVLMKAKTIIWNGPLGVFEREPFSLGTKEIAMTISESTAFSFAGGGDTVAAINIFGLTERISYISTGGGASLDFLSGKVLPSVHALQKKINT
jgi:phosphoglycerate kinase